MIKYFLFGCYLNSLVSALVAVFVLIKAPSKKINVLWCLFGISVALWSLGLGRMSCSVDQRTATFWLEKVHYLGAIFIPTLFLHFVLAMTKMDNDKRGRLIILSAYIFSVTMLVANFSHALATVVPKEPFNYYTYPGPLYNAFSVGFFVYIVYSLYVLYHEYKHLSGIKRNQFKYLFFGMGVGFAGGSTAFFPVYNIPIPPVGIIFASLYIAIVSYAIVKYHLLDIKVVITRASMFVVVYAFVMGIPFFLLYHINSQILTLIVAMVLATIGPILYRKLQQKSENLLLAKQREYQKLLRNVSKEMLRVRDLDKLLPYIVESVTNAVNPEFSAIYLAHEGEYVLKAWRKVNPEPAYSSISAGHPMIKVLKNVGPIVFYDEMKENISEIALPLHLLISLNVDNRLVGILLLGKKMDGDMYSSDDLDVFEILARQAALAIDYCMFNKEFQKNERKIYGDELRASVTGMAKTVAHQMVNQLSKFSMPAQYLNMEFEKFLEENASLVKANPNLKEAINNVFKVSGEIEINVQKARNMLDKMSYFVKFQSEIAHAHDSLDIKPLMDMAMNEVRNKHSLRDIQINISIPEGARIYGIKSMVYDTLYNLLDNAYDAVEHNAEARSQKEIAEPYIPSITIAQLDHADRAVISVTDNGIGMNGKIYDKVCNPFFTSKSSATASIGIGLYMVKCMVEEIHNGKLWFESEYGVGSVFYVSFPHRKA